MGSTVGKIYLIVLKGDHPHIHGEHHALVYCYPSILGSPPYTWGALHVGLKLGEIKRITPIYMGSTLFASSRFLHVRDHPHIHGEHKCPICQEHHDMGSPPYTWGARSGDPD